MSNRALLAGLGPLRRELERIELFERPGTPKAELARCLRDIARLNRIGPILTLLSSVAPFFARHAGAEPLTVLDVGTGAADIPAALVRWARARGRPVRVLALDVQPVVLECAAGTVRECPEIRLVGGEAGRPPVRPDGVDLAICSLMLHHLPEDGVVALLRTMASVARLGFVVSDLRRTRAAWVAAWLLTRVTSRSQLTRHDGPLSVERAYTRPELARLSATAGLSGVRWTNAIAFRVLGVYERPGCRRGRT